MNDLLRIREKDSVAVALRDLKAGEAARYEGGELLLRDDIPMGHKAALKKISKGEAAVKYGFPIGEATEDILPGGHVHTHNLHTLLKGESAYAWRPVRTPRETAPPVSFMGFRRGDGRVGVRNEIWIIPTVGCVNDVAAAVAREGQRLVSGAVEGVHTFRHPYGCSQMGDDQENTRRILAGLAGHPNAGGVLLLGLGCENSGVDSILDRMEGDRARVRTLVCQNVKDELAEGLRLVTELAAGMARDKRVPCDTSSLVVGLKCGGSDGLSGITANPVIGAFSDWLTARGGSTILTEVPEMFGAETILMSRARDEKVFQKTVDLINGFKKYFESYGQPVYENPSPGNKQGGITTLEDKALGCTQKSGAAEVRDVLPYGGRVREKGLNLLSAPGNDLVASTALAAAGAQIILFSTGRGTPFGCPVPTVKISSNTALYEKKPGWIDFDAGELLSGGTVFSHGERLAGLTLRVAGGERTTGEKHGFRDLAIFKSGVTL